MEADPHVLTGYNITRFDLPYLIQRAEILGGDDLQNYYAKFSQIKH
jgi:DNA polymerase elongation subunit (family B)